ncbi:P-type ATPase [Tieghemostelium lacteum]|uniref:Cation-transporting ATPase n=1 Tax=Tieghemostelium lacteum TaxID=361077 RepID=A0A151ZRY6_TIELA|nr:P-type ATPase [Tieghemostelium lacteum]|eukprot:KYQ96690.1 P-type ATPase [Tieghemostelium lacteum]
MSSKEKKPKKPKDTLGSSQNNIKIKEDALEIEYIRGYKRELEATIFYWGLVICSGFTLLLVYYWLPRWDLKMLYKECPLNEAEYVYVKGKDKTFSFCKVNKIAVGKGGLAFEEGDKLERMFLYKFTRMFYREDTNTYEQRKSKTLYTRDEISEIMKTGLSMESHMNETDYSGLNIIDVPLKSIPKLLLEEVLHPFFIFQIYSIILWITEQYYYYCMAIFFIASASAVFSLREIRGNLIKLRDIAKFSCQINVLRQGRFQQVSSDTLVPGDIVELTKSTTLPCDFCLLSGTVILNESMLTGESIPVTKYPLEECSGDVLSVDSNVNKRCAMSGGTLVVKTQAKDNQKILAMVTRTGWLTLKGELVLSMLYPKSSHFKFFQESIRFLLVLCGIAMVGFGISIWRLLKIGISHSEVIVRALDLITIVVPPALPMAQSVGTGFSILRLKARSIFCISPPRVSMAGKVEVFCFDKTGTLTEDGLDLLGVIPVHQQNFAPLVKECNRMSGPLFLTMATCHTLAYIDDKISGDPLEEKIFIATDAKLNDNHQKYCATVRFERENQNHSTQVFPISTDKLEESEEIALVDRFEFQSALQRMSVIVRGITKDEISSPDYAIVKGSPEMIKKLSVKESVPLDFDKVLATYTKKGYRVLACGYKEWNRELFNMGKSKDEIRLEAEKDLHFLGFIIMENKIKPETPPALQILKKAEIRMIMVTGDNVLTAVSVARDCGLLDMDKTIFMSELVRDPITDQQTIIWNDVTSSDESVPYRLDPHTLTVDSGAYDFNNYVLAVTGDCWRVFYEEFKQKGPTIAFNQILRRGHVFARMTPDQKQNLVEELQNLNLYVGMCGDGANDCGALKAAHVGISLSLAEASIAAPFTSTICNIACTHELIREGRASLAVSFKLFQFIGMYSLIQFAQVILLYMDGSVLGNWMYLYQDLWVIFPMVIFMGRTEPCKKLSIKRPSSRLISSTVIGSLLSHVTLTGVFLTLVFVNVQKQPWYHEVNLDDQHIISYICTSLFIYGNLQYSIMAFIYSWGHPFLKPIYTNYMLFACFVITLLTSLLLLLLPTASVWKFAQLLVVPVGWRLRLLILFLINACISMGVEWIILIYRNQRTKKKRQLKKLQQSDSVVKNTINEKYTSLQ